MSAPPPPPATLAYSTHAPGEPIFSARSDGLPGVEVDIPPQAQRWRANWPPRSAGTWVAVLLAAAGALAPLVVIAWWAIRTRDPQAIVMLMLAGFVEFFFLVGVLVFVGEGGRRRTTILGGPDGLTITTVGGMAWSRPRHWTRGEIGDLVLNVPGADTQESIVLILADRRRPPESLGNTLLVPKRDVELIVSRLRDALGMPPLAGRRDGAK